MTATTIALPSSPDAHPPLDSDRISQADLSDHLTVLSYGALGHQCPPHTSAQANAERAPGANTTIVMPIPVIFTDEPASKSLQHAIHTWFNINRLPNDTVNAFQ